MTKYDLTFVPPPAGGTEAIPQDINSAGKVAGYDAASPERAFLFEGGICSVVAPGAMPAGMAAEGYALSSNHHPAVVGMLYQPTTPPSDVRAFRYQNGTLNDLHANHLSALGGKMSWARDVNAHDSVVGGMVVGSGILHVWFLSGKTAVDLTVDVNGDFVDVAALNDAGQVAGTIYGQEGAYRYDTNTKALDLCPGLIPQAMNGKGRIVGIRNTWGDQPTFGLWDPDQSDSASWVSGLGGKVCRPNAINNGGVVVGSCNLANANPEILHGFVYDGTVHDLNDLVINRGGWTIDDATGVDEHGRIVGTAVGPFGSPAGVLLTPHPTVPESSLDQYAIYATILFGIIGGGSGWEIVNGKLRHVGDPGPNDPQPTARLAADLTAGQRDVLTGFSLNGLASLIQDPTARAALERLSRELVSEAGQRMNSGVATPLAAAPELTRRAQPRRAPAVEAVLAHFGGRDVRSREDR
jgi:uncharacterized membrane protein